MYDCYMKLPKCLQARVARNRTILERSLVCFAAIAAIVFSATAALAEEPAKYKHGVIIDLDGEIGPGLEAYVFRKLDAAKEAGADLVVIEIDSPGGRLVESLEIAKKLSKTDWAHTVAYVPKSAYSGAAVASLGCDEIVMGPNANWGDAGAIFRDEKSFFHYVPEKFLSAFTSELDSLAQAKNRPPALAESLK